MVDLSASCAASQPPKRLGLEVTVNEHGRLIVTKLMPGPISAAGVLIGDELVMVGEDNKTINQPFSNLSDFLHGEGTMPTKFGFLRPGLRDIIEVDVCDGSQAPQSIQESRGKPQCTNWSKGICTVVMKSTLKGQKSLPAPDWTRWDGPDDEPIDLVEQGVGYDQTSSSKPLLHPVTCAGETVVLRSLISGRLQATLLCLGGSCLLCLLLFLMLEDHPIFHV